MHADVGRVRVEFAARWERVVLGAGVGWERVEKLFVLVLSVVPKHINFISSKIAKHVDVLKLFASSALRTIGPQQLLHYDVTRGGQALL